MANVFARYPFFFDGNSWFGIVDTEEKFRELLTSYGYDLEVLEKALLAGPLDIAETPPEYHFGVMAARTGKLPNFGFRREHSNGTVTFGEWCRNRGIDLKAIAKGSKN